MRHLFHADLKEMMTWPYATWERHRIWADKWLEANRAHPADG